MERRGYYDLWDFIQFLEHRDNSDRRHSLVTFFRSQGFSGGDIKRMMGKELEIERENCLPRLKWS